LPNSKVGGWIADVTDSPRLDTTVYPSGNWDLVFSNASPSWPWIGKTAIFIRIGHSLFAMLAAVIGGLASRRLFNAALAPAPAPVR
jgi:hypothetical protein